MYTQLHNSSSIRPSSTWTQQRARLALSAWLLVGVGAAYGQTPARWVGGSADWSDAGCWDIGAVPNNAGAATYVAIIDVPGQALQISVTNAITISGLVQTESVEIPAGGVLKVSGAVTNWGVMTAAGGSLHLANASVNGAGGVLSAQGGVVMLEESAVQGGTLRATDDAASAVRFSGTVTLHGVAWDDPGVGEFQIRNTSAQLLGDFADQLPAGCTLVVWADRTWTASQWTLAGGEFVNDGVIVLRHGGGGYSGYPTLHWETSGTLAGTGEILLSGQGNDTRWNGEDGVTVTIGPNQWVHGHAEISVRVLNQGRIEADLADKHLRLTAGIDNTGTVRVSNGRLTLNGSILQRGTLEAAGGTLFLTDTIVDCAGASIEATGSPVVIENSTINAGTLRAAADEGSAVRFIGEVTMNGVLWDDAGSEGFQIYNATARLLGDYEHQLPSSYTLLVWANRTWTPSQWMLTGGDFVNDGLIVLRHGGSGYSGYPTLHWESSGTLTGSGEIVLSGQGDDTRWTGAEGAAVTIGPNQWVHGRGMIQPALVNQGLIEADLDGKRLRLEGGLENSGTAVARLGELAVSGTVLQRGTLASRGGLLRFLNASVDCMGEEISAEGSMMTLENTFLAGGTLRVTDDEASVVRFVGDVTMTDVEWDDPGAGQFQIYNTTARLLGDYANGLPHGYELLVWANRTWDQTQCILRGGDFVNDGLILLRHTGGGYSGYPTLHWENSGTLNGSGEVVLSGQGDDTRWTGEEGVTVTIGSNQWVHGRGELRVNLVNNGLLEADLADKRLRITGTTVNHSYAGAVLGGRLMFSGGLDNQGDTFLAEDSQMAIGGDAITDRDLLTPSGARLELTGTTMDLAGHRLIADSGILVITDSSLRDGALEATDDPASQIRFAGDVTLTNVTWIDPGQGEFMVYNTTARLLGDFADELPGGYRLIVWANRSWDATRLDLPDADFANNGTIELRHGGGGYSGYPTLHWVASGTLGGTGEVHLSGAGDSARWTAPQDVAVTIGPEQWVHGRGEIHLDLVNQGILEADIANRTLRIVGSLDNEGIVRVAPDARLVIDEDLTNNELVQLSGGALDINGSISVGPDGRFQTEAPGVVYVGRHLLGVAANAQDYGSTAQFIFDGASTPRPELTAEAFFIEAEDFNYDRGQHLAVADTMPYLGGAYDGYGGRDRIDYHQSDNNTSSDLYRAGEGPDVNVNIYALAQFERGTYRATMNYKVGRNDPDDWYNYTRVFPTPARPAYLFARLSSGSHANAIQIDEVTGNASTPTQSLTKLGEARGPASGDWNRFNLVPVRDDTGNLVLFEWSGPKTLRVTALSGGNEDMDYFVFAPAASSGPAQLVEVMSQDLGGSGAGFAGKFAIASLRVAADSEVRLVDLEDNASGAGSEALYVDTLAVSAGGILDLNGLRLYTHAAVVDGTIVNGAVVEVQDEAPVLRIVRVGDHVELRWTATATGFGLVATGNLLPPCAWNPVSTAPVVDGADRVVTEPFAAQARFYRLQSE